MSVVFLLTFCVSFLSLFILRPLAIKFGLVDKPNFRKRHTGFIPLTGGLVLFTGNVCFYLLEWDQMRLPELYLFCTTVLLVVGVLDDRYDLNPFLRAGVQSILAILMVYFGNLYLNNLGQIIGPFQFSLGTVGIIITIFATMAVINAFNMIDGIDGLLGGLSSVTFAAMGVLLIIDGQVNEAYWCFALIFAILPYVMCNLSLFGAKFKIFMGDSGSTLIGFTIIWILLISTQGKGHAMNPVTALWVIAVPLSDIILIVYRRLRQGKSPFRPDRLHVHHLMVRAGLSSRKAFLVITLLAMLCAGFGIAGEVYYINEWIMFIAFILFFFVYAYSITRVWRVNRWILRLKRRAGLKNKYKKIDSYSNKS